MKVGENLFSTLYSCSFFHLEFWIGAVSATIYIHTVLPKQAGKAPSIQTTLYLQL